MYTPHDPPRSTILWSCLSRPRHDTSPLLPMRCECDSSSGCVGSLVTGSHTFDCVILSKRMASNVSNVSENGRHGHGGERKPVSSSAWALKERWMACPGICGAVQMGQGGRQQAAQQLVARRKRHLGSTITTALSSNCCCAELPAY
jgi:hypothetical protein